MNDETYPIVRDRCKRCGDLTTCWDTTDGDGYFCLSCLEHEAVYWPNQLEQAQLAGLSREAS